MEFLIALPKRYYGDVTAFATLKSSGWLEFHISRSSKHPYNPNVRRHVTFKAANNNTETREADVSSVRVNYPLFQYYAASIISLIPLGMLI